MARRTWALPGLMVLLVGACSPSGGGETPTAVTSSTRPSTTTSTVAAAPGTTALADSPSTGPAGRGASLREEYRTDRQASLYLPDDRQEAPLVVMVPGGGWRTSDPSGYTELASFLTEAGAAALTVELGSAESGSSYPAPLEDLACAVAFGAARTKEAGINPDPVVLMGHSSGAHLASLLALGASTVPSDCQDPPVEVDALVGLAGVYDVDRLPALAIFLFGVSPDDDPALWEEGNPLLRVDRRPELPVLLLHGGSDRLVPVSFTQDFAVALTEAGHDTAVAIVEGADHGEVLLPRFSGDAILEWMESLSASG